MLACFVGINFFFVLNGWITEHVMDKKNKDNNHMSPQTVSVFTSFCSILTALVVLFFMGVKVPLSQLLSFNEMKLGFFQFAATFFTINSAALISYPMMVIFKSAKVLPVIFFGLIRGVYTFNLQRLLMSVFITIGLLLFSYDKVKDAHIDSIYGMAFASIALFFDGVVGS